MSLEEWKTTFELLGLVALLATFGFAFGAWYFSRAVNKVQAEQLRQFDKGLTEAKTELAKQQARAADAEKALREVDSKTEGFRLAIANANERAAKAEENLGNAKKDAALALQQAAEANRIAEEEKLKRVQIEERMKPRAFRPTPQQISSLQAYKGTEYTFSAVFGDEESINLLKQLDGILLSAGWIRVKPPHAFPAINVYGKEQDFAVASGLRSGIKVFVDSDTPFAALQATPVDKLPPPTGAAVVLALELTSSLAPPQEDGIKTNVDPGKSMTVRIEIGRKP
jgi:hypothetical protein